MFATYYKHNDLCPVIGQTVYIVREVDNARYGVQRRLALDGQAHTNGSHEPRERGYLGESDNIARYAEGRAVITAIFWPRDPWGNVLRYEPAPRIRCRREARERWRD